MSFTPVKPISTAFYLWSYIGGMAGGLVAIFLGAAALGVNQGMTENGHQSANILIGIGIGLVIVGVGLIVYGTIVLLRLYYKMWEAIQDGYVRTTPGKAVGFMFIPIFNIYWIFQAFWGYAKDYNSFIARHSIPAPPLPESLFLIFCIFSLLANIPYLGALIGLANAVIMIVLMIKICSGINALANAPAAVTPETPFAVKPLENWRGS